MPKSTDRLRPAISASRSVIIDLFCCLGLYLRDGTLMRHLFALPPSLAVVTSSRCAAPESVCNIDSMNRAGRNGYHLPSRRADAPFRWLRARTRLDIDSRSPRYTRLTGNSAIVPRKDAEFRRIVCSTLTTGFILCFQFQFLTFLERSTAALFHALTVSFVLLQRAKGQFDSDVYPQWQMNRNSFLLNGMISNLICYRRLNVCEMRKVSRM